MTLTRLIEFDNVEPRLNSGIFKCIFWLNGSFLGVMVAISEKDGQDLSNGTNSPLKSPTVFLSSNL
jgi:hypothetical protein